MGPHHRHLHVASRVARTRGRGPPPARSLCSRRHPRLCFPAGTTPRPICQKLAQRPRSHQWLHRAERLARRRFLSAPQTSRSRDRRARNTRRESRRLCTLYPTRARTPSPRPVANHQNSIGQRFHRNPPRQCHAVHPRPCAGHPLPSGLRSLCTARIHRCAGPAATTLEIVSHLL